MTNRLTFFRREERLELSPIVLEMQYILRLHPCDGYVMFEPLEKSQSVVSSMVSCIAITSGNKGNNQQNKITF